MAKINKNVPDKNIQRKDKHRNAKGPPANMKHGNKNDKSKTTKPTTSFKNNRNQQQNNTEKKVRKTPFSVQKQAEYAAKAEAKAIRIKNQKARRLEKTIIISKKTRRGQPLMKDRISFLLNKIQESRK